jgi:hypothetical protein
MSGWYDAHADERKAWLQNVDWRVVGPKLVEALESADECLDFCLCLSNEPEPNMRHALEIIRGVWGEVGRNHDGLAFKK